MAQYSVAELAKELGITRQRVNDFCKRGDLVRGDNKKIDTNHPVNACWLAARQTAPPPPHPPGRWGGVQQPSPPPEAGAEMLDVDAILSGSIDLRTVAKVDVEKLHKLEALQKLRVEREHKRGELVERRLVQTVFAKLFTIDSNEWLTMGAKLAAEIAGLMGSDDPTLVLRIEKLVDAQARKTLAHVKRLLDDFLVKIGAEGDI